MSLYEVTITSLNYSAFVYLAACFAYVIALSRSAPHKKERWTAWAHWVTVLGFALHTFGLGGRWVIGGLGRPPWTNLYESLIAFAWGVVLFTLYIQQRWRLRLMGTVSLPLVFVLMGMSVMTANKAVEPLIPALQSNWLKIHVLFGILAYAGFTVAGSLAYLHLMRRGISLSRIGAGLALMTLVNLSIAGGQEAFTTGRFYMAKTVERQLPTGETVKTKATSRNEAGVVVTEMEPVPYAHLPFWLSYGAFLGAAVLLWTRRRRPIQENAGADDEDPSPEAAARQGWDLHPLSKGFFVAGVAGLLAFFAVTALAMRGSTTLTLSSNPYLTMLLFTTVFFCGMFLVLQARYSRFLSALPSAPLLDEFGYKNILFAFPFQTLLLVTGAIWADNAWGRPWGWDPKETWAFITWLVYLIYLHGKLLMRWSSTLLSVVAIVGFIVLVFAFLGVNLVLSGLHSYGAA